MKKCEVLADRISLTVCKGSIVIVDDNQAEIARQFLKPMAKAEPAEEKTEEKEEKPAKKSKK